MKETAMEWIRCKGRIKKSPTYKAWKIYAHSIYLCSYFITSRRQIRGTVLYGVIVDKEVEIIFHQDTFLSM